MTTYEIIGQKRILLDRQDPDSSIKVILVRCPKPDCRGWFMVPPSWRQLHRIKRGDEEVWFVTKPCPHCFKVSRLPERWWPKHIQELYSSRDKQAREYFMSATTRADWRAR